MLLVIYNPVHQTVINEFAGWPIFLALCTQLCLLSVSCGLILWHINHCWLFNAESSLYIYILALCYKCIGAIWNANSLVQVFEVSSSYPFPMRIAIIQRVCMYFLNLFTMRVMRHKASFNTENSLFEFPIFLFLDWLHNQSQKILASLSILPQRRKNWIYAFTAKWNVNSLVQVLKSVRRYHSLRR